MMALPLRDRPHRPTLRFSIRVSGSRASRIRGTQFYFCPPQANSGGHRPKLAQSGSTQAIYVPISGYRADPESTNLGRFRSIRGRGQSTTRICLESAKLARESVKLDQHLPGAGQLWARDQPNLAGTQPHSSNVCPDSQAGPDSAKPCPISTKAQTSTKIYAQKRPSTARNGPNLSRLR